MKIEVFISNEEACQHMNDPDNSWIFDRLKGAGFPIDENGVFSEKGTVDATMCTHENLIVYTWMGEDES